MRKQGFGAVEPNIALLGIVILFVDMFRPVNVTFIPRLNVVLAIEFHDIVVALLENPAQI